MVSRSKILDNIVYCTKIKRRKVYLQVKRMSATHPPVLYLLQEEMEKELEAPWATVEEDVKSTTGVSLLAVCSGTEQEHPWQQNDVETSSPSSPASSPLPQHTTCTTNTTNSTFAVLYPTRPTPSAHSFSVPRHERSRRRSSVPCTGGSSSILPPLTLDREGEEEIAATGETDERKREGKREEAVAATLFCFLDEEQGRRAATAQPTTTAWVELLVAKRQTMDYLNEGVEFAQSTYQAAWGMVGAVWRALTSKTARRTLLTTALVSLGSAFLFGLACLGYLAFHHEYLPDQITTVPVHLQYG